VLLFFVLSGFVLTRSILRKSQFNYAAYVFQRIARIYLPYLAGLLLAVAACAAFREQVPPWTRWLSGVWPMAPNAHNIWQHVLFIGAYPLVFNYAFWTLVIEMRVSLILPFLVMGLRALPARLAFLLTGAWALLDSIAAGRLATPSLTLLSAVVETAHYAVFFTFGGLLWLHREKLASLFAGFGRALRAAFVAVGFLLFEYGRVIILHAQPHAPFGAIQFRADLVGALGASAILFAAIENARIARALSRQSLFWLGDISYSLYLCHGTVILVLSAVLGRHLPVVPYVALCILGSLAVAKLMALAFEEPAQHLGRAVDQRLRGSARSS
jgi:peptidoglycan/LPS O-acetylase OafA/YrhL